MLGVGESTATVTLLTQAAQRGGWASGIVLDGRLSNHQQAQVPVSSWMVQATERQVVRLSTSRLGAWVASNPTVVAGVQLGANAGAEERVQEQCLELCRADCERTPLFRDPFERGVSLGLTPYNLFLSVLKDRLPTCVLDESRRRAMTYIAFCRSLKKNLWSVDPWTVA